MDNESIFLMVYMVFLLGSVLITLLVVAVSLFFTCFIHKNMGLPWWSAIVPYYNSYVLFKATGINPWLFLLLLVPFANIAGMVFVFIAMYRVCQCFGYGIGMFIMYILIPPVALGILAFTKHTYQPLYEKVM